MISIQTFVFNQFQENTYVLYDHTGACIIIDPGCRPGHEQRTLQRFIAERELKPVALVNTHCHIDHVLGNAWVQETYSLPLTAHPDDAFLIENLPAIAQVYRMEVVPSPPIERFLHHGDKLHFGESSLEVIHVPGHSPGGLVFYTPDQGFMVVGDVLFDGSIGRSDLPGGNHEQLVGAIKTHLLAKPHSTVVYSGHGKPTTIGKETMHNPFLR